MCEGNHRLLQIYASELPQFTLYKGVRLSGRRTRVIAGQTIVITGAAAGIGRELTLLYAKAGARLVAVDRDAKALESLGDHAKKYGFDVEPVEVDVTRPMVLAELAERLIKERKQIHVWINNAGIAPLGGFLDISAETFDRVLDVNLKAVVNGTRVALQTMEAQGFGRIINMASIAGHLPAPFMSAYNASKHGVVGFTRSLQAELRLTGSPVSILLVSPGFVNTEIIARGTALGFPEWLSFMLAKPFDVAKAIVGATHSSRLELYPTANGKLMKRLYHWAPKTTVKSARLLMARSWKDFLLNRIDPMAFSRPDEQPKAGSGNDPNS